MTDKEKKTKELAYQRSLVRLNKTDEFRVFRARLREELDSKYEEMAESQEIEHIYRSQGAIVVLKSIIEAADNAQKIMNNLEKQLRDSSE